MLLNFNGNTLLLKFHKKLFADHPLNSTVIGYLIYAAAMLLLVNHLGVSSNFIIIIPLISAALAYGLPGGAIAGATGLPLNLLFFNMFGSMEYAPESLFVTEISGIVLGTAIGYLSEYFRTIDNARKELAEALESNQLLLNELNHRVKNNLNIIKDLLQLQLTRSDNPEFIEEGKKIIERVHSIALTHEFLHSKDQSLKSNIDNFIRELINNISEIYDTNNVIIESDIHTGNLTLSNKQLTFMGLIINEVICNSLKYAAPKDNELKLSIAIFIENSYLQLKIQDNGPGFSLDELTGNRGLGILLISSISKTLKAEYSFKKNNGCLFELSFNLSSGYRADD